MREEDDIKEEEENSENLREIERRNSGDGI
jgi:hypothetical protein